MSVEEVAVNEAAIDYDHHMATCYVCRHQDRTTCSKAKLLALHLRQARAALAAVQEGGK